MGQSSSKIKTKSKIFKKSSFRKKKSINNQQKQSPQEQQSLTPNGLNEPIGSSSSNTNGEIINGYTNGATKDLQQQQHINGGHGGDGTAAAAAATAYGVSNGIVSHTTTATDDVVCPSSTTNGTNGHHNYHHLCISVPKIEQQQQQNDQKSMKEKSQSMARLFGNASGNGIKRAESVKSNKSTKTKTGSTFNLRRVNSLKYMFGSNNNKKKTRTRKRRTKKDDDDEMNYNVTVQFESNLDNLTAYNSPDSELQQCYFSQLYEFKLHLRIFSYLTLSEKMCIRAVCRKWQCDVFKQQYHIPYPLFHAVMVGNPNSNSSKLLEEKRSALLASNKYLCWCPSVRQLCITERLTRTLLENLCKYCFSSELNCMQFLARNMNKCEVIASNVLEQFSEKFGKQLQVIEIDAQVYSNSGVMMTMINNDLTDVILFLLYTNSEHYANLVRLTLQISNKLTNGYFQMFQTEFGEQLRELSIELCFDSDAFVQEARKTIHRIGQFMRRIRTLHVALRPKPSIVTIEGEKRARLNISPVIDLIGKLLPQMIESIESISLAVDIVHVNCSTLDLVKPLAAFSNAKTISLLVYGNLKEVDEAGLRFHFDHLATNHKLEQLTVDSAKLNDTDVEQLVQSCPRLRQLNLRGDVRMTLASTDQISQHLHHLTKLCIGQASGSLAKRGWLPQWSTKVMTSNKPPNTVAVAVANREALFIDNDSLILLLNTAPITMRSLREIVLENCRIDLENIKVLEQFISFTAYQPESSFYITLRHNRYPLIRVSKFYTKYEEYIPKNLHLYWS